MSICTRSWDLNVNKTYCVEHSFVIYKSKYKTYNLSEKIVMKRA